jgi:hypothetical protein
MTGSLTAEMLCGCLYHLTNYTRRRLMANFQDPVSITGSSTIRSYKQSYKTVFCYNKNSTLTSPPSTERWIDRMNVPEEFKKVDTWEDDIKDYDNPLIGVNVDSFDELLGKLFTTFELLGLPDRQGKALRSTIRKMSWEWYDKHLPNPSGLASPSLQARRLRQIDSSDIIK